MAININEFFNLKILIFTPAFPYPPDAGNRIDIWGHIRFFLDRSCNVRLIIGTSRKEVRESLIEVVSELGIECYFFESTDWFYKPTKHFIDQIQQIVNTYLPDIAMCEYAQFSLIVKSINFKGAELWFRSHNFEIMHYLEKAFYSLLLIKWSFADFWLNLPKCIFGILHHALKSFLAERIMCILADRILHISTSDMRIMSLIYPGKRKSCWIVPFIEADPILIKRNKVKLDVVYLGSDFVSNVNREGAFNLIFNIIPEIEKVLPGKFHFNIVGQNSKIYLSSHQSSIITVHGYIDNLDSFLQNMDIACYPLHIGWGMKLKVLKAIASGMPVLGYPEAFRGINGKTEAYYCCRNSSDFVAAFINLLDPDKRETISIQTKTAYSCWKEDAKNIMCQYLKLVTLKKVTM